MSIWNQAIIVVTVPGFWPAAVSITMTAVLYGAIINGNARRLFLWLLPLAVFPFLADALHAAVLEGTGASTVISPYLVAGVVALLSFGGAMVGGLLTRRQDRKAAARQDVFYVQVEQFLSHR